MNNDYPPTEMTPDFEVHMQENAHVQSADVPVEPGSPRAEGWRLRREMCLNGDHGPGH